MPARKHNKNNHKHQQPTGHNPQPLATTECPDWLLYPIYGMIDNFENQNALNAITALLQKYPKSQLCRGLKAVVQMRLGYQQEAYDLACEIKNEHPHQLVVLQTLLYTFRPLGKLDDIESMYKQAYTSMPTSEEHASLLIQAYLRQFKYSDMHSVIIQSKSNSKYPFMVALSTYLESKYTPDTDDQAILKHVNFKRMVQFQTTNKLTTFDQVSLLLMIFLLAEQYPTRHLIDQCLAGVPHTKLDWSFLILEYLKPGTTELFSACKEILESNPDDWHAWTKYIDCVKLLNIPQAEAHQFIHTIQLQCHQQSIRGPYLAPIALASHLQIPCETLVLDTFWTKFASKPCFYTDIHPYLSSTARSWVMNLNPPILTGIPKNVVGRSNLQFLRRVYAIESTMEDLFTEYQVAYQLDLEMHLLDTDARLSDPFLLLMVLKVLDDMNLASSKVACIGLLESALVRSPSNAVFKILLIAMYLDMGTFTRALDIYTTLDIKQIQLDTHSYHLLDRLTNIGVSKPAHCFASQVMIIYTSNSCETPELIVDAFQSQAYSKVDEFIQFYDRLQYSITRAVAVTELWRASALQALDDHPTSGVVVMPTTSGLDFDPMSYIYDQRDRSLIPKSRGGEYVCQAAQSDIHSLQYKVLGFHLVRMVLELSVLDLCAGNSSNLSGLVDQLDAWVTMHGGGLDFHGTWVVVAVIGAFARAVLYKDGGLDDAEDLLHNQFNQVLNHLQSEIQHVKDLFNDQVTCWGFQMGLISTLVSSVIEAVMYLGVMCAKVRSSTNCIFNRELDLFTNQVHSLILEDLGYVLQLMQEHNNTGSTQACLQSAFQMSDFDGGKVWFDGMVRHGEVVDKSIRVILGEWESALRQFRTRVRVLDSCFVMH